MADNFKTFMSLSDEETAKEISDILTAGKVQHHIHDSKKDFDPSFSQSDVGKSILLQIRPQDFKMAEALINDKLELREEHIDPDHFLHGFSEDELKDVIKNADEWHPLDVKLSKHLLGKKGIQISTDELQSFKKQRLVEQSIPEKTATEWIIAGYAFAFLGGFLGFFIGYHLLYFKKTLSDGSQVLNYTSKDRFHGRIILLISILCAALWTLRFVFTEK